MNVNVQQVPRRSPNITQGAASSVSVDVQSPVEANIQQVTGSSVDITQGADSSLNIQAYVLLQIQGFEVLTGLGNPAEDFAIFQAALNRTAAQHKGVYIPPNEHLRLNDFPRFTET